MAVTELSSESRTPERVGGTAFKAGATHRIAHPEQRPVSVIGWALAVVFGVALWALAYLLVTL